MNRKCVGPTVRAPGRLQIVWPLGSSAQDGTLDKCEMRTAGRQGCSKVGRGESGSGFTEKHLDGPVARVWSK